MSEERETLTYEAFGTAGRELAQQWKDLPAPRHPQARGGILQGGRIGALGSALDVENLFVMNVAAPSRVPS